MWYRNIAVFSLALLSASALAAVSCTSSPETEPDQPTHQDFTGPGVLDAYQTASSWLPTEPRFVVAGSGTSIWELAGDALLPTSIPDAEPGSLGTVEGVRADFEHIMIDELGFNPALTDTAVIAASTDQLVGTFFGDFDEPTELPTVDVGERTAYELDLRQLGIRSRNVSELYLMFVDEPRRGLVVTARPDTLRQRLNHRRSDDSSGDTPGHIDEDFARLFGIVDDSTIAVAISLGPLADDIVADFPIPELGVVGARANHTSAVFEDSPEVLEAIDSTVSSDLKDIQRTLRSFFPDNRPNFQQRLGSAYVDHFVESLAHQMEPEFGDNQLRYDVTLSGFSGHTSYLLGFGAALGIPAFTTYINRAKAAEAEGYIRSITDGARAYFEGDQQFSTPDGAEPWHRPDQKQDRQQIGMPVEFGDKTYPGGTGIKIVSHPQIPQEGEQLPANPQVVEGDVDFEATDVFRALGIDFDEPTYFRYVYETGPHTGEDATATIRAEHNFEPRSPRHHTVIQELTVDHGAAVAFPMYTVDEFQ